MAEIIKLQKKMENELRLCKNCVYCKVKIHDYILTGYMFAKCTHPESIKVKNFNYLVTGKYNNGDNYYCTTMRSFECGTAGVFFEPKR